MNTNRLMIIVIIVVITMYIYIFIKQYYKNNNNNNFVFISNIIKNRLFNSNNPHHYQDKKYRWRKRYIVAIKRVPIDSINAILDQNNQYLNIKRQESIQQKHINIELKYYSLKQLIENFGTNINKKHTNYVCPIVSSCKTSILLSHTEDDDERLYNRNRIKRQYRYNKNQNRIKALINMVSHCGRVQSKRSQQYFENVNVHNNKKDDDYEKILLCGEGGSRTKEFIHEIKRYDIAMLFNTRPFSSSIGTKLLYFNPHIRDGIKYIKSFMVNDLDVNVNYNVRRTTMMRPYLIGIFISNCDAKLKRNKYVLNLIHHFNDNHVKSFGKCFQVNGIRTNVKEFLKINSNSEEKQVIIDGDSINYRKKYPNNIRINNWHDEKIKALNYFQFTIAMENTIIGNPFYITEKIFDAFKAGSLPIYYGSDEIYLFVPNHSIIDVKKFQNNEVELIQYIEYLNHNQTAYEEYFKWKQRNHPSMVEYINRPWIKSGLLDDNWQCRLCMFLAGRREGGI